MELAKSSNDAVNKDRILKLPEVMHRTGLSKSSIYSYIERGLFPGNIILGTRNVGWRERDIDAWIASRQSATTA